MLSVLENIKYQDCFEGFKKKKKCYSHGLILEVKGPNNVTALDFSGQEV